MVKTVHIHTDLKFVSATSRFDEAHFDNEVVIIGNLERYSGPYHEQARLFSYDKIDFSHIIQICSDAEIVVLYALDPIKSRIALSLPDNVFIAWRFFGYELYRRGVTLYLSDHSLFYRNQEKGFRNRVRASLGQLKFLLQYGSSQDAFFAKAVNRANAFLGLSLYEYEHLLDSWGVLPPFIQLPMLPLEDVCCEKQSKENIVIIGNNRNAYNNHLDIIELIEESHCDPQLSFLLPFSYGGETPYTNAVRHFATQSSKDFRLLEEFMDRDAYFALIGKAKAAIFNGYRQMAMGNIFVLLGAGVKVYLNTRNAIYRWFVDLGLKVFTIEDCKLDLESNSLELDMADRLINVQRLKQLEMEFSQDKFTTDIIAALSGSNGRCLR